MLLGIDTGGTFTDFVYYDGKSVKIHKVLSTPDMPERAILQGISELEIDLNDLRVIHGSTVATNALLEGKGARTVYITNHGLGDVLAIGRQNRRELYNLQPEPVKPPVPRELCLETGGRINAHGDIIEELTQEDIDQLGKSIDHLQPDAVAINLLYSFIDDNFEKKIAGALPESLFISCSSDIFPGQGEYERGITTWLNAYVGPLMQRYLKQVSDDIAPAKLAVMRSSGQTCLAQQAGREAVHLLLSGPAGGLSGVRFIGRKSKQQRFLTFDMGGTSTDVALIDGEIRLTSHGIIGGYPVAIPMVDMHTIGAGGGSIAVVDAGGVLQVGPESAGAVPGPACYGQGGDQATITDANLVLGRLPESTLLGGTLPLDLEKARKSLNILIQPLGLNNVNEAATGIVRVANENMAQALHMISVQRGIDPREFTLVAFGGAGGLHICALAGILGMTKAMVPVYAGVLSALGMLVAPPGRQLVKTIGMLLSEYSLDSIQNAFDELIESARSALIEEGVKVTDLCVLQSVDLCYRGQAFTLNLDWQGIESTEANFHKQHERQFGHRLDFPVELVNIRVGVIAPEIDVDLEMHNPKGPAGSQPEYETMVYGIDGLVPVWKRSKLALAQYVSGPAIIIDEVSTVFIEPGWECQLDKCGNIFLENKLANA